MSGLDMELQSRSSREGFLTVGIIAHEAVDILVAALVMLQVLFQLEGLSTVFVGTLKNSVW